MAQMAFQIQAVGVLGGVADLIIGVKTSAIKIFRMSVFGSTSLVSSITTRHPFDIRHDSILDTLTNQVVDFQVSGVQAAWGDLSVNFKVYRADGSVGYDETRAAATMGTTVGGFSRSAMRLSLVDPRSDLSQFLAGMLNLS